LRIAERAVNSALFSDEKKRADSAHWLCLAARLCVISLSTPWPLAGDVKLARFSILNGVFSGFLWPSRAACSWSTARWLTACPMTACRTCATTPSKLTVIRRRSSVDRGSPYVVEGCESAAVVNDDGEWWLWWRQPEPRSGLILVEVVDADGGDHRSLECT